MALPLFTTINFFINPSWRSTNNGSKIVYVLSTQYNKANLLEKSCRSNINYIAYVWEVAFEDLAKEA